ncbi:unnamed protein product [Linum trigynum]|uniref:Uncharacterized protein n=1 Tax=Linum trigynum TaxID=586398 RepID=A0AAV2DY56_9ROSI
MDTPNPPSPLLLRDGRMSDRSLRLVLLCQQHLCHSKIFYGLDFCHQRRVNSFTRPFIFDCMIASAIWVAPTNAARVQLLGWKEIPPL